MVKDIFKKSIKMMIEDGEFTKIIANAKGAMEKSKARKDYAMVMGICEKIDIEDFPFPALITMFSSVDVLKDVISYMVVVECKLLKAEKTATKGE